MITTLQPQPASAMGVRMTRFINLGAKALKQAGKLVDKVGTGVTIACISNEVTGASKLTGQSCFKLPKLR